MEGMSGYERNEWVFFRVRGSYPLDTFTLIKTQIEEYWFQKCVISLLINVIQMSATHFQYWCGLHLLHLFNISAVLT